MLFESYKYGKTHMSSWTFITNHGAVLAIIGQHDRITAREIAAELEITERSVLRIIKDLEADGYINKQRIGRTNRYKVNREAPLRRKAGRDVVVGALLRVLSNELS